MMNTNFLHIIPPIPVVIGERLKVGNLIPTASVKSFVWVEKECRWRILLDWGSHGTSIVYGNDEGKVWRRISTSN
jgi:hypothetical protein